MNSRRLLQYGTLVIPLAGALFWTGMLPVDAATTAKITAKTPPIEIAGWIPYWRKATGTIETLNHIDTFSEISPFGYTVKQDGTLFDAMKINEEPWLALMQSARDKKVKVIPTVMWANADAMDAVLRSPKKRKAHIAQIVAEVKTHNFDGIDIDYEGKKAKTKNYFSLFLKELYAAIGKKYVVCTIEARTPLADRFDKIPKDIQFANDLVAINKYCDRVRIMTYDQGSIDLRLNESSPKPYIPVSDPKWVEKVIRLMMKSIAKKKIEIGVPTYGYEYEARALTMGYRYDMLWAFNPRYAIELAAELGITPFRNSAGELNFIYATTSVSTPDNVATDTPLSNNPLVAGVLLGMETKVKETFDGPFRILWWSDAKAIKDKVDLAKKLGVRGVAIFKIDGGGDPGVWEVLH